MIFKCMLEKAGTEWKQKPLCPTYAEKGGGGVSKKYFFRLVLRFKTPHPPFLVKYDVKKLGIVKVYYVYIIFIYIIKYISMEITCSFCNHLYSRFQHYLLALNKTNSLKRKWLANYSTKNIKNKNVNTWI